MSQLKISDLYKEINSKKIKKLEIFDSILKKCHQRILYNSKLERTYCFFNIPEFIFGVPLYDINELTKYMINSLVTNGFKVKYFDPNVIFITWNDKTYEISMKQPTQKLIQKSKKTYRSVDAHQSEKFIYDSFTSNTLKDKTKSLFL
jgi:hypothetical protein